MTIYATTYAGESDAGAKFTGEVLDTGEIYLSLTNEDGDEMETVLTQEEAIAIGNMLRVLATEAAQRDADEVADAEEDDEAEEALADNSCEVCG